MQPLKEYLDKIKEERGEKDKEEEPNQEDIQELDEKLA